MDFTCIDRCVAAATKIHNAFEDCKNGHFKGGEWWNDMPSWIAAISPANGLKNEYIDNHIKAVALGAASEIELNELYRSKIETCQELCPYLPSELIWKVEPPCPFYVPSREWLESAVDIDKSTCILTWPVMRQLDRCSKYFDYDDAGEWLWQTNSMQNRVHNTITALVEWWNEVEPHPELKPLFECSKANTRRAQKMFSRAVRAKFMDVTETGYEWKLTQNGLGYFLGRVYCDVDEIPQNELSRLFGIERISAYIYYASKHQCREAGKIEQMIFYDE